MAKQQQSHARVQRAHPGTGRAIALPDNQQTGLGERGLVLGVGYARNGLQSGQKGGDTKTETPAEELFRIWADKES